MLTRDELHEHVHRNVPFALPRLEGRSIRPDDAFRSAPRDPSHGYDGLLVDGKWQADLYSNGFEEDDNPTPIEAARNALEQRLRKLLGS